MAGDAPGTVVYVGAKRTEDIKLELVTYDQTNFSQQEISDKEISLIHKNVGVNWLNVIGIHNANLIEKIGKEFNIHPLVLEDIVNTSQQPKIEEYSELIYAVMKMFYVDTKDEIQMEQINFIIKKNLLISFQEIPGDVFQPVRKRLKEGRKKIRNSNSDYLLYTMMDSVVDNYYTVIRKIGKNMELLKKSITNNANHEDLIVLDKLYEETLIIQNSIEPLKKMIPELEEFELEFLDDAHHIYYRDLQDHISQISLTIDAVKDKLSSMNDYYLSVVSNRTNEVMKTLALVATICVPITVIAGIYGMNFQHMPEVSSPFAYPIVLGVMAGIGGTLFGYFKKKRWI